MEWEYTVTGGRRLRRGYSTGSCAAAASRAAVEMLFTGRLLRTVKIDTPAGVHLTLPVSNITREKGSVVCSVRKDAGDDPDITDGIDLFARAVAATVPGITLRAGPGVGTVTRPGLQVPVGKPAINPAPEAMILKEVAEVLPPGGGVEIELSIPGGETLASRTLNPRLGVAGGLSILGTSGLVEPMSERSFQQTLALELRAARAAHKGPLVLASGNFGKKLAADDLGLPAESVVKIGNHIGFSLDRCLELKVEKVLLAGHLGKLIKVSAGIFNTHSRTADARFEIFAAHASLLGAGKEVIIRLQNAATTEEMMEILDGIADPGFYRRLAERISGRAESFLHGEIQVGSVLLSFKRGLLAMDKSAKSILEGFN